MTRSIYIDGVNEAAAVRIPDGFTGTAAAEQGAVSIGTIEIDDPDGTFDLKNLNSAYIVESAASSQRVWTGFLYNLTIERGSYRAGASRIWRADCVDVNNLLTRRVVGTSNGNRPAETDLARLTWLLGNPALSGLVAAGAYTNLTDNPRNLDAANYYWQTPMEVLADIAPQCGKIAFAIYNPVSDAVELFYDLIDSTIYDSSAKISNIEADLGAGVYEPFVDATLERVGENLASKVILRWVGGITVMENTTTLATYGEMMTTWESSRIGRQSTAEAQAAVVLANRSLPEETVTCQVPLPKANVNDILEGQRIQVKFSHLPGWGQDGDYVYGRVIRRAIAVRDDGDYLVQLTLSNKVRPPLGGGPPVTTFPHQSTPPTIVQQVSGAGNLHLGTPIGAGNTLIYATTVRGHGVLTGGYDFTTHGYTACPDGESYDPSGGITAAVYYKLADGTESQYLGGVGLIPTHELNGTWYEVSGTLTPDQHAEFAAAGTGLSTPSITVAANSFTVGVAAQGHGGAYDSVASTISFTEGAGWTEDLDAYNPAGGSPSGVTAHRFDSGSIAFTATSTGHSGLSGTDYDYIAQIVSFVGSSADQPPMPGQPVPWTVVTVTPGSTTSTGTTAFPYANGTLLVKVDGVLISTASYTETDPTTGAFTLNWVIDSDEVVTVSYLGR